MTNPFRPSSAVRSQLVDMENGKRKEKSDQPKRKKKRRRKKRKRYR
jgi:hypothetical protein